MAINECLNYSFQSCTHNTRAQTPPTVSSKLLQGACKYATTPGLIIFKKYMFEYALVECVNGRFACHGKCDPESSLSKPVQDLAKSLRSSCYSEPSQSQHTTFSLFNIRQSLFSYSFSSPTSTHITRDRLSV